MDRVKIVVLVDGPGEAVDRVIARVAKAVATPPKGVRTTIDVSGPMDAPKVVSFGYRKVSTFRQYELVPRMAVGGNMKNASFGRVQDEQGRGWCGYDMHGHPVPEAQGKRTRAEAARRVWEHWQKFYGGTVAARPPGKSR